MEQTLVVLKPDAVQRRLVGQVLARLEQKGLRIAALKMLTVDPARARDMYSVHEGKDFYPRLVEFMTSSPVVAMVLEGNAVIDVVRTLVGPTFGPDAPGGTIRGDFGVSRRFNLIHASDSPQSARREIPIFFGLSEVQQYEMRDEVWVYDLTGKQPV